MACAVQKNSTAVSGDTFMVIVNDRGVIIFRTDLTEVFGGNEIISRASGADPGVVILTVRIIHIVVIGSYDTVIKSAAWVGQVAESIRYIKAA